MLRCSFFCFMESYWRLPWNLLVKFFFFFFAVRFYFPAALLWSIFFWNHPKIPVFFNCLLCSGFLLAHRVSLRWQAFLRPGASWVPFDIRGWGTGRARCSVIAHRLCWWEVLRMHVGVSASTLWDPPSYIPHCPAHYFLLAGNVRNCCRCNRLLSSRVVLALYSCLHGFLGSRENKPLSWIRTLISSPNW